MYVYFPITHKNFSIRILFLLFVSDVLVVVPKDEGEKKSYPQIQKFISTQYEGNKMKIEFKALDHNFSELQALNYLYENKIIHVIRKLEYIKAPP